MEEEKGRGKTRSCADCGGKIASRIKFLLTGWTLHIFCKNPSKKEASKECGFDNEVRLGFKPVILVSGAVVIALFFTISGQINANKVTCPSFKTPDRTWAQARAAAQNYYDSQLPGYEALDGWDKDRKVCE